MNLSITLIIVLVTVAISLYASENQDLKRKFLLNPYQVHNQKQFYRVISHAFIHADFMHLGVNMYVLYSFGTNLEKTFVTIFGDIGLVYFVALYIGGIIFASLLSLQKHRDNPGYNSLGASGAVSAVLFASILIYPFSKLLLFGVVPIVALLFGVLYIGYEMYENKKRRSNIAHDAHLMGALFGILFTIILNPSYFLDNFIFQWKNFF